MSNIYASGSPTSISVNGVLATTPNQITNFVVALKDVEETITLPANAQRFKLKARNNSRLKVAYISGETATNYWTIYPGDVLEENYIDRVSTVIYIQTSKDGEVIEITTWT